jgi:hypothetical protein
MIFKFIIKNIYKIILFFYLLLFSKELEICYKIQNFNYGIVLVLYLLSLLLYWFYSEIIIKFTYKVLLTVSIFSIVLILFFYRGVNPYTYICNDFINVRSSYLESLYIDFTLLIPFLIIIIPVCISIIFSLRDRVPFITLILTLPIMYLLWYNGFSTKFYTNIYIILSCFDIGINIHLQSLRKAKNNNYKVLMVANNNTLYIAIMVALVVSFTALAGEIFGVKSIEQFNSDKIKNLISSVDSVKNIYGLNYSGYGSNSSKLGGPININYNLALKVKSSKPMYLRGNVLEYYNGFGWSKGTDGYYMLNNRTMSKVVKSEKIEISPQTLTTSTFLAPLNTFSIVSEKNNILYNTSDVFIVGNKSIVSAPYTAEYDLTQGEKFINDASYEKEVNEKYKKYLQLPDNITSETYNLVNDLLKDCKNNTEKINKINKYLLENFKYSLVVRRVPKDKEFLDYFLFSEKSGYCTYFATAATIFARIAGVPARYVEGFNMDNTMDSDGVYLVGNNRAHAWSEILTSPSKNSWEILDCTPGYSGDNVQHEIIMPLTNSKDIIVTNNETERANVNKMLIPNISYLFILGIIGLVFILLVSIVVFIRIKKLLKNKNRILYCNGVIPMYYYSKKRLCTLGIKWSDSLSDEQGALGLKDELLRHHFIVIVSVFYEEYYGGNLDTSFNKIDFHKYLESYIRKNSNFFKYYYNLLKN